MKDDMIASEKSNPSPLVRFENVSKKYGRILALNDVSFEIKEGEIIGFLGPNGAGKTTAMRILSGFFPPTQGRVRIKGADFFKHPKKAKRFLGYLPESVNLYPDMKVCEYLKFVAKLKGVRRRDFNVHVRGKMELCGLGQVGHRLIGRLSKGYRQRVGIAQALIGDPALLILDEPTTGLDPKQITEIRELIRALGHNRGIILSTHILPEVSMLCHRVMMINQGRIIASGTVRELESCLKDRDGVHVVIQSKQYEEAALRLLRALPGVEGLKSCEAARGEIDLSFETSYAEDLRPRITKLFVEHGIPVVEIQRVKLALEEIFLHLLKEGKVEGKPS
ncbi:MAG TPA: ATP-binding cassette domain-containing protein [Candidatus Omnitrophota bacterium]|nr:ATP-binding cassette domain-containing protein [Candidatus Omnitrophota bacterium]HPS37568.1 ATP-binding cassette domain-containing protein [Candidatus Omnitrophota bacterium]